MHISGSALYTRIYRVKEHKNISNPLLYYRCERRYNAEQWLRVFFFGPMTKKKSNIETKLDESNHVNSEYNMQFEIVEIALDHVWPIRMLPHKAN